MPQKISRNAIRQVVRDYIDKEMVPHAPDQWALATFGAAKSFVPRVINGYLDKHAAMLRLDGTLDAKDMIDLDLALETGLDAMATAKKLAVGPLEFDADDVRAIIGIARTLPQCVTASDAATAPETINHAVNMTMGEDE